MEIKYMKMTYLEHLFEIHNKKQLGVVSCDNTCIQVMIPQEHPIRDFITNEELMRPWSNKIYHRFGAVVPKGFVSTDFTVPYNYSGDPLFLAWLIPSNLLNDILDSIKKVIEWLNSNDFIVETEKFNTLSARFNFLNQKIYSDDIFFEEKDKYIKEQAIINNELEIDDLKWRGRNWNF